MVIVQCKIRSGKLLKQVIIFYLRCPVALEEAKRAREVAVLASSTQNVGEGLIEVASVGPDWRKTIGHVAMSIGIIHEHVPVILQPPVVLFAPNHKSQMPLVIHYSLDLAVSESSKHFLDRGKGLDASSRHQHVEQARRDRLLQHPKSRIHKVVYTRCMRCGRDLLEICGVACH